MLWPVSTTLRQGVKNLLTAVTDLYPFSRKSVVTLCLLSLMGVCLSRLPRPYNVAAFSTGVTVLSTDYRLLRRLGFDGVYRAITKPDLVSRANDQYRRKQFVERGPDRVELTAEDDGNFRGRVSEGNEHVYVGLRFLLYVEAPIEENRVRGDVDTYHLRLGTVEVTDVSETSGGRDTVTIFLSVSQWVTEFEDKRQAELAQSVRSQFDSRDGTDTGSEGTRTSRRPFAKVESRGQINEFSLDQWRAISRWVADEFGD